MFYANIHKYEWVSTTFFLREQQMYDIAMLNTIIPSSSKSNKNNSNGHIPINKYDFHKGNRE